MKNIKYKSFLLQIMIYFVLVLLIPACTILLLYWQADKMLRNQINVSSRDTLNQFFCAIDISLEEAEDILIRIMNDEDCKEYGRRGVYMKDGLGYQAYMTHKSLGNYTSEHYSDIFCYYPHSDKVISGVNTVANKKNYFMAHYDIDNDKTKEQIEQVLNYENQSPRLFSIDSGDGKTSLCVAKLNQTKGDIRQRYISVVVISSSYLQNFLNDTGDSLHGKFLIYGEEKEQLFGEERIQIELSDHQEEKGIIYEVDKEQEKYMVWTQESEVLSGYYSYVIPETYYWKQLVNFRFIFFLGFLGCIVLSIIVAYNLSNKAYLPINRMVDFVKDTTQKTYDGINTSEFNYVTRKVAEERSKVLQMNHQLDNNKKVISEYYIQQLLGGNVSKLSGRKEFEHSVVEMHTPYFFTAVIAAEKTTHEPDLLFLLKNVFCELFDEKHKGYVIGLADKQYALVVNYKSEPNISEQNEILERGRKFFWEKLGIALFIGVGSVKEGIDNISSSYNEAKETLRYRYLYGNNCVLQYEQIKERQLRFQMTAESKIFNRFISYITRCENFESPELFVEDLCKENGISNVVSIDTAVLFKNMAAASVNNVLVSRKVHDNKIEDMLNNVVSSVTLEEFKRQLSQILNELYEHEKEENSVSEWVRQYVLENYFNCDLNVKSISDCLNMYYGDVSRCFKEAYNMKLIDYIAQVRIQNAKSLLVETEYDMTKIAEKCGFLDSNIFIKTFKKVEGITPGAYRKTVRQ